MVGEIRDRETAEMALQAAETGHLVLSTLHSGTAIEALGRLRHLGVPAYLLADSLRLVVTQRLIRRLCDRCKVIDAKHGGFSPGHGCEACQQGHSQRIGLFEHIEMSPALAQLCLSGADRHALQACAVKSGWSSLRAGGEALWQQGSVSRHELHRVLGYEEA
jgi:type II secretory ATPase GspE/PulE/Tfp pilus assembly ATPase PilB-like protein